MITLMFKWKSFNIYIILQEVFFVNINQLIPCSEGWEMRRIKSTMKLQIFWSICFLPIYLASTIFRLLTFILLFTYLNIWAFCPMMISWILNVSNLHLKKSNVITKNSDQGFKNAQNILVATSAIFIPIFLTDKTLGTLNSSHIFIQFCFYLN